MFAPAYNSRANGVSELLNITCAPILDNLKKVSRNLFWSSNEKPFSVYEVKLEVADKGIYGGSKYTKSFSLTSCTLS